MGRGEVNAKVLRPRGRYSEVDTTSILLDAADNFIFTNDTDAQDIQEICLSQKGTQPFYKSSGQGDVLVLFLARMIEAKLIWLQHIIPKPPGPWN